MSGRVNFVRGKKLAAAASRNVEEREKEWVRADNVGDRRCVNIESTTGEKTLCTRAWSGRARFETDNGADKTLSSIPGSDVWERNISERVKESWRRMSSQDIQLSHSRSSSVPLSRRTLNPSIARNSHPPCISRPPSTRKAKRLPVTGLELPGVFNSRESAQISSRDTSH